MDRSTINPVMSRIMGQLYLGALLDPLTTDPIKIKLYKTGPTNQTPFNIASDFTECDFVGYAAVSVLVADLNVGVNVPNGNGQAAQTTATFIAGSLVGSQAALGYLVTDSTGTILYYSEAFTSPVNFTVVSDYLALDVLLAVLQVGSVA